MNVVKPVIRKSLGSGWYVAYGNTVIHYATWTNARDGALTWLHKPAVEHHTQHSVACNVCLKVFTVRDGDVFPPHFWPYARPGLNFDTHRDRWCVNSGQPI